MATPETLAGVTDLSEWLGEPITAEVDVKRATRCLRLASSLVRAATRREWVDEAGMLVDPLPDAVHMVTLYCASRVYENREAMTRGSIDDADGGWKVDEAGAYLTASEKQTLAGVSSSPTGGLRTVATTRSSVASVNGLVPTDTPDVFFPWY